MFRLFLALGLMSCSVDINLERRPCPCAPGSGWSCDEELNQCVSGEVGQCGLSVATERSSVLIESFELSWRTDEAIELRWAIDEASTSLIDHYDLVLGTDEESVRGRAAGATVFDSDSQEHPELLRSALPYTNDGDEVDRVVLRDLEPDTTYFVRLTVFDTSGAVSCSPVLEALTWTPTTNVKLFDELPASDPMPLCVEHIEDPSRASSGSYFSQYTARCERRGTGPSLAICEEPTTAAESCYENLRLNGLDLLQPNISPGQFNSVAHVRLDIALVDTENAFWSEFGLRGPAPSPEDDPNALPGSSFLWLVNRRTFVADGTYRTYSAPLSTMTLRCTNSQQEADDVRVADGAEPECGRTMTIDDALRGFYGARAGGELSHLGSIRLDNVSIHL